MPASIKMSLRTSPISSARERLGVTTEETLRKTERHLARVDPVMKRLIREHGGCPLAQRAYQPFDMLINSIISQQLSRAAAASIKRRRGEIT